MVHKVWARRANVALVGGHTTWGPRNCRIDSAICGNQWVTLSHCPKHPCHTFPTAQTTVVTLLQCPNSCCHTFAMPKPFLSHFPTAQTTFVTRPHRPNNFCHTHPNTLIPCAPRGPRLGHTCHAFVTLLSHSPEDLNTLCTPWPTPGSHLSRFRHTFVTLIRTP